MPVADGHGRAEVGQLPFEFVDLTVGPTPFFFVAKTFDPLDHHAAVPGAIEDRDVARLGNLVPKSPEVVRLQMSVTKVEIFGPSR